MNKQEREIRKKEVYDAISQSTLCIQERAGCYGILISLIETGVSEQILAMLGIPDFSHIDMYSFGIHAHVFGSGDRVVRVREVSEKDMSQRRLESFNAAVRKMHDHETPVIGALECILFDCGVYSFALELFEKLNTRVDPSIKDMPKIIARLNSFDLTQLTKTERWELRVKIDVKIGELFSPGILNNREVVDFIERNASRFAELNTSFGLSKDFHLQPVLSHDDLHPGNIMRDSAGEHVVIDNDSLLTEWRMIDMIETYGIPTSILTYSNPIEDQLAGFFESDIIRTYYEESARILSRQTALAS